MEHHKTFVVFNPVAGTLDQERVYRDLGNLLAEHRIEHEVYRTERGDDLHILNVSMGLSSQALSEQFHS